MAKHKRDGCQQNSWVLSVSKSLKAILQKTHYSTEGKCGRSCIGILGSSQFDLSGPRDIRSPVVVNVYIP